MSLTRSLRPLTEKYCSIRKLHVSQFVSFRGPIFVFVEKPVLLLRYVEVVPGRHTGVDSRRRQCALTGRLGCGSHSSCIRRLDGFAIGYVFCVLPGRSWTVPMLGLHAMTGLLVPRLLTSCSGVPELGLLAPERRLLPDGTSAGYGASVSVLVLFFSFHMWLAYLAVSS